MATATVTELVTRTLRPSATASSTNRAPPQGGIFEGLNPTEYDPKNPIVLFIIQASFVIILTRIIHFPLTYMRQPRVIAEVLTGIILGPSILGRIPGFSDAIFPQASIPGFSLVANLGLLLFLFLVGLEVDLRFLASNWRVALSVGAAGMAFPFGLGAAIAWGLYHEFRNDPGLAPIGFGTYMLFIGVAMAITAFPVLCRILTSLKLLGTDVGIIVLSAGVGNDVVGWVLLALCVALVNSGAGLTALYILLVAVGYVLFLVYAIRPAFVWVLRRSGSLANGPTQTVVALTLLLVLASAFFTAVIGIHPIFGAFMVGLICPHEGGFAIKLTEKIEDLVSTLFLPLYFALSGLNTNLGLLDNGITWAYVVGVCAIAFFAKIAGGTIASRLNGLVWRESLTIGCLMSCKGLVELIVLNIGLQARILSKRTFTIFVVMALVTTFATTPLVMWLYPPWYQRKLELWKQGKIDWDGNPLHPDEDGYSSDENSLRKHEVARKVLAYLRLDGLPSLFTMVSLLGGRNEISEESQPATLATGDHSRKSDKFVPPFVTRRRPVRVHALRLMQLTERDSDVMKVSELEDFASKDPIIKALGTFGQSSDVAVDGQIAVVPERSFPGTLLSRAKELGSELVVIPWSETGSLSEYPALFYNRSVDPLANRDFARLVLETYEKAREHCHVAVFIDKAVFTESKMVPGANSDRFGHQLVKIPTGMSLHDKTRSTVTFAPADDGRRRLIVLYQGTEDDLFAVKMSLQLARNETVDVKILGIKFREETQTQNQQQEQHDQQELHHEFDALRDNIPDYMKQRVTFMDLDTNSLEGIAALVQEKSAAETVLILGRDSRDVRIGSVAITNRDESRTLGMFATNALNMVREKSLDTSLMIVQAKRETTEEALRRQKSIITEE